MLSCASPVTLWVDGSLLWLGVPFALVEVYDPTFRNTLTRIRQELVEPGGGVRRYLGDTFYGGSEWILLLIAGGISPTCSPGSRTPGWSASTCSPANFAARRVRQADAQPRRLLRRSRAGPLGRQRTR